MIYLNKMEEKANFQLEETELKLMDYMDDNLKLKTNLQQITKEKMERAGERGGDRGRKRV